MEGSDSGLGKVRPLRRSEAEREQIKAEKDEAFTESKVESAQSRQDKANEHFERAAAKLQ